MARNCIAAGAVLALMAVIAGALGAHGLQSLLNEQQHSWYEKAVFYHFIHSLGLIGIGCASAVLGPSRLLLTSAIAMTLGMGAFSGTLYILAVTPWGWVSAVTPFGGSVLILGWLLFAAAALRAPSR